MSRQISNTNPVITWKIMIYKKKKEVNNTQSYSSIIGPHAKMSLFLHSRQLIYFIDDFYIDLAIKGKKR